MMNQNRDPKDMILMIGFVFIMLLALILVDVFLDPYPIELFGS